jgi:hypothetical protein
MLLIFVDVSFLLLLPNLLILSSFSSHHADADVLAQAQAETIKISPGRQLHHERQLHHTSVTTFSSSSIGLFETILK